jgi:hypothetical protein
MAMFVAIREPKGGESNPAMLDFQNLAQASKNCCDISELILHSTLRLIAFEEQVFHMATEKRK